MGCDIHPVLEKNHTFADGSVKWVGINSFEHFWEYVPRENKTHSHLCCYPITRRNYTFFASIAGVRGEGPSPKGLPRDASDLSTYLSDRDGRDGHSHSWQPLSFIIEKALASQIDANRVFLDPNDIRSRDPLRYFFGLELFGNDTIDNYRLVFWFDN